MRKIISSLMKKFSLGGKLGLVGFLGIIVSSIWRICLEIFGIGVTGNFEIFVLLAFYSMIFVVLIANTIEVFAFLFQLRYYKHKNQELLNSIMLNFCYYVAWTTALVLGLGISL